MDSAAIVVLPLCYENAVSYGTGTGTGPYHFLEASEQLETMDEETLIDWSLLKIHTVEPLTPSSDPETAVRQMEKAAARVLDRNKFLLSVGGDHAICIGPLRAVKKRWPNAGVLQIDAHLDLRHEWNGSRYNHACVMRRVTDDLKLPVVQVGIRSFSPEEADIVRQRSLKPFYAHNIQAGDDTWIAQVVDALPQTVYVTLDLDGLDPAAVPGTGTPEPGRTLLSTGGRAD